MTESGEGHSTILLIGEGEDGKFYPSAYIEWINSDNEDDDKDFDNPKVDGNGCATLKAAAEKEIGTLIEFMMKKGDYPKVVQDYRNELKRLADGGEPIPA